MWMLLHGFSGAPESWDPVLEAAALSKPPLRPALTGHAEEWRLDAADSFESEVARLATLAEALEPPRCIAGYSLGARVALGLIATRPELFDAALLIGVHPGLGDESQRAERRALDSERARFLRSEGVRAFVAVWEELPLFESQRQLPVSARQRQRAIRLARDAAGLATSLEVLGLGLMPSFERALAEGEVPLTLMAGARDSKFADIASELAERHPRVDAILVEGVGHNLLLEAPDRVASELLRIEACVQKEASA
jgi:2-succinyl-6-hydroxy-2,4-cyclohexadiene-1-carboxylate synthase